MEKPSKIIQIAITSPRDAIQHGPAYGPNGMPYKSETLYALMQDGRIFYYELQNGLPSVNQDHWIEFPAFSE